jgi:hypothetical protein
MTDPTLGDALPAEIARVEGLLPLYAEAGPAAGFSIAMMQHSLRAAIEQATADLRERLAKAEADSNVWAERYRKAALERDEARAELARLTELLSDVRAVEAELAEKSDELARLTTLRPLSEWKDGDYNVLWWYRRNDGGMYGLQSRFEHCLGWTPLPEVKEAT